MKLPFELNALFARDLDRLVGELDAYEKDENLWSIQGDIKNAPGNLILHICGNLKHFIGATLDNTEYVRDRELEFSGTATREELYDNILETKEVLATYFERVTAEDMSDPYPLQPFGYPMTKSQFLVHLYGHLHWHMGQINYYRRLIGVE